MLIANIYVNFNKIITETAVRIKGGTKANDINTYRLHDGCTVKHRYGDGAEKLVEKMMRHVKKHGGLE